MNDKGDFYIGNTKISSSSGQQTTFDIPIPTITGEDPNRLSLVADEVIVKERILVEGGTSKQILSQFDGPVTFNENVRLANPNRRLDVLGEIRAQDANFGDDTNATSVSNAPVVLKGGVGIAKDVYLGEDVIGDGATNISGITSVTASYADNEGFFGNGAGLTNTGADLTTATSGSERVVLTSLTSGTMTVAKTDPQLTFNFGTNTLNCTNFVGDLTGDVTGNASSASLVDVNTFNTSPGDDKQYDIVLVDGSGNTQQLGRDAGLRYNPIDEILDVDNGVLTNGIRIGISSATEIDTTSENLYLDSAGGTVEILDNLTVRGDTILGNSKANDTITCTGVLFANRGQDASSTTTGSLRVTGGAGITQNLYVGKDIVAFYSSDINLKENLAVIPNALDKVGLITGYTYNWKSDTNYDYLNGNADTGVIAQDVEALGLPGITTTRDDGVKAVRYERLVPVLIEAVKELTARVKALESS